MAEIVNLRRVRKAKARAEKDKAAAANRSLHGIARPVREQAGAEAEKAGQALDGHRLEPDK